MQSSKPSSRNSRLIEHAIQNLKPYTAVGLHRHARDSQLIENKGSIERHHRKIRPTYSSLFY